MGKSDKSIAEMQAKIEDLESQVRAYSRLLDEIADERDCALAMLDDALAKLQNGDDK